MGIIPLADVLEALFTKQVEKCNHFAQVYSLYKMRVTHQGEEKSYEKLMSIVKTHLEDRHKSKMRNQNDNTGGSRIAKAAPSTDARKKGDCIQWNKSGTCSRGKNCPWDHVDSKKGTRSGSPEGKGRGKGGKRGKGKSNSPSATRDGRRGVRSPSAT